MVNNISNRIENQTKPFLKWAGGKRWFVDKHSYLLPKSFNRYFEPFIGSGAVFFYLCPENAVLGDTNSDLIETYKAIKENWRLVYNYLKEHQINHTMEYYYQIRNGKPKSIAAKAARFIYLNRSCWNGLYRVNKRGYFNVPIGTRSSIVRNDDCFDKISERLKAAELYTCDFEILINMAGEGDLVFVDPPYTVRHNNNAFIKYNEKLFSWNDQKRLSLALYRAKNRGALIVATNAYHQSILELYQEGFSTLALSRNSCISSDAHNRKKFKELVIFSETNNGK